MNAPNFLRKKKTLQPTRQATFFWSNVNATTCPLCAGQSEVISREKRKLWQQWAWASWKMCFFVLSLSVFPRFWRLIEGNFCFWCLNNWLEAKSKRHILRDWWTTEKLQQDVFLFSLPKTIFQLAHSIFLFFGGEFHSAFCVHVSCIIRSIVF